MLAFGLSKASVFIGPLMLSSFMTNSEYGKMEYSLGGLGFILNTILGFGIPASYAYFLLSKKDETVKIGYSLYVLFLVAYFILIQGSYFIFPRYIYLSLTISYILANQVFYSYMFKTHGKSVYATLMDGGIYFILILVTIFYNLIDIGLEFDTFYFPMFIYGLGFALVGIYKNKSIDFREAWIQLKKIIPYSLQLLISAFLIILLINSGRFILEFYSNDFEEIGIFGFYLRISGISLVIFQMLFIMYFKEIYTYNFKRLDFIFTIFLGLILIYSLTSFYMLPPFLKHFSVFFNDSFEKNKVVFYALTFFTFFWTVYNIFSNILVREGLVKEFNYYLLSILVIFAMILFFIPDVDVVLFSKVQLGIGILVVACQQILLFNHGIIFRKSIAIVFIAVVFSSMLLLLY